MKMKLAIVKAHESFKVGDVIEATPEQAIALINDGFCVTASEYEAKQSIVKAKHDAVKAEVVKAKSEGKIAPKDETIEASKLALVDSGNDLSLVLESIRNLPVQDKSNLSSRITAAGQESESHDVQIGDMSLRETVKGYLKASEPFSKTVRQGGILRAAKGDSRAIEDAVAASRVRASIGKKLADMVSAGADFSFNKDVITAGTDYADPAGALGVLNTGLTLQWNLGFLANQLAVIDDITTDISNTPVMFNQYARTRYIKVPGVMLKTSSNSWALNASAGNDVDVNVLMDTHAGVPITINNNILGSTARQLFNEQKAPQMYGLGEYIIYKLVNTIVNGSTRIANDGSSTSTIKFNPNYTNPTNGNTFNVAGASLSTFVADLPAAMDLAKFPGGDEEDGAADLQRFAWVHTSVYSGVAADTNYILNQSIQGIKQNIGENLIQTGRFTRIGNTKFRKSQLITDQCATTGTGADGGANAIFVTPGNYRNATTVGFAGTRSSLLFVSRVPLDYTKVMPEIPSTAAIELVTEPKTGITFMVVKYLDHAYETANMRVQLMFGTAIGDERQGMLLNAK
jgi:hypothetical protein